MMMMMMMMVQMMRGSRERRTFGTGIAEE